MLLKIHPSTEQIEPQRFEWYDDTYDKGYQGVVDVLQLPGEDFALISVQRSSRVIVHDLDGGVKRGEVDLGGRGGNPTLQFGNADGEIWASDYDTLVVLRANHLQILRRALLQEASAGTRQFIGDYAFQPDQDICVVARPFSHDIVGIDTVGLKVKASARLGRQPLEVAALAHGRVVARDWKTGDVLHGRLE